MPHTLTKTVQAFKFSELSPSAKQLAIEKLYDINLYDEWAELSIDHFKAVGKIIGVDIEKIYFSGFSSQGDGACFDGSYFYKKGCLSAIKSYAPKDTALHSIVKNLCDFQALHSYKVGAKVKHSGHYYHAYCTEFEILIRDKDGYMQDSYLPFKEADKLRILLRDFMNWMYRRLNDEYDYLTSETSIIETINSNDYDFTENGHFPDI